MKFLSQKEDFYVAICLSYSKGLVTNLVLRPDHPFWTHALRKKWFVCTTRAVCQHSHICIAYVRECVSFHSQTDAHYVICSKSLLGTAHERKKQIISIPTSLCEWIVFRWQPHHYVICLSAKGNWFAQRLEWTVICQRSRSPHLLICELKFIHSSGTIYEHIVWMNCLSLTATPLCDLSVCERQLIRTKVRMDSSLSAQPIASFLSANWNSFTHQVPFTKGNSFTQ